MSKGPWEPLTYEQLRNAEEVHRDGSHIWTPEEEDTLLKMAHGFNNLRQFLQNRSMIVYLGHFTKRDGTFGTAYVMSGGGGGGVSRNVIVGSSDLGISSGGGAGGSGGSGGNFPPMDQGQPDGT